MEFKGSRTEANLMAAFAGESQARTKYTFYAAQARNTMPGTVDNLLDAAAGERYEWTEMYADFAKTAREEGFKDIAAAFELVGKIEQRHEERFKKLADNIQTGKVFQRDENTLWICLNCGHVHRGAQPPTMCHT